MSKRSLVLCCSILASVGLGCGPSLKDGFARLTPAVPEEPRTDVEVLLRMALRRAVVDARGVPDYGLLPDPHKIVVLKRDSLITPRILPLSDSVRFVILSPEEIRQFADRYDHFVYVTVIVGPLAGDSDWVSASITWASSKKRPRMVYMSGGSCTWQYRRRGGTWTFDHSIGCLII